VNMMNFYRQTVLGKTDSGELFKLV